MQDLELPPGYNRNAPHIATQAISLCTICSSASRKHLASCQDYELETCSNTWNFWRCDSCSAIWLDPRPAVETLGIIYPAHYYAYDFSKKLSSFVLWGKAKLDGIKFEKILKVLGRTPHSYLDVGCGDGRYLKLIAEKGTPRQNVFGMELSSAAVEHVRNQGFTAFEKRVEDCDEIPDGSLDLISMFHVIEHVDDPVAVLKRLSAWLTPDGLIALETPNADSLDARIFKDRWWGGYHVPRHWTIFDARSMSRALAEADLEMVSVSYRTGHSFWLYSFHHWLRYNSRFPMPRVGKWFDPVSSRLALLAVTSFDILRGALGAKTSAMLVFARKRKPA